MKRLVICCDGTWNRLDARYPTNVVKFAESVASYDTAQNSQVVFYDEGVGTGGAVVRTVEKLWGGAFGEGLLQNVEDAYRFLIFNYDPGDDLVVVGFSRGAYTARSLVGLIRNCGILARRDASKVKEAMKLYRSRTESTKPDSDVACEFRRSWSPAIYLSDHELDWRKSVDSNFDPSSCTRLEFSYMGVWDTVGALGIPDHWAAAGISKKKYMFHDNSLSSCVKSARHAIAIDERRKVFAPTYWENLELLNEALGSNPDGSARYLQVWFPGDHGSVGGGGNVVGLSDDAFEWIAEGALNAGVHFSTDQSAAINNTNSDFRVSLENNTEKRGLNILSLTQRADRAGPQRSDNVSESAWNRWCEKAENVYEKKIYRPGSLRNVEGQLKSYCLVNTNKLSG